MSTKDNKIFWERVAKFYTPLQERGNRKLYLQTIRHLTQYLTKDMRVLEIGSGTGQFTFVLYDRVAYYEATDFSEKMIQEAKKIRSEGIHYSVQDATKLTYSDESFSAVIIANVLHVMPDPAKALSEIYRVLKPNGLLIAPTFIYEGKMNKLRLWFLERVGFKTFHKWSSAGYTNYIRNQRFKIVEHLVFAGKLLPECLVIAKKN